MKLTTIFYVFMSVSVSVSLFFYCYSFCCVLYMSLVKFILNIITRTKALNFDCFHWNIHRLIIDDILLYRATQFIAYTRLFSFPLTSSLCQIFTREKQACSVHCTQRVYYSMTFVFFLCAEKSTDNSNCDWYQPIAVRGEENEWDNDKSICIECIPKITIGQGNNGIHTVT